LVGGRRERKKSKRQNHGKRGLQKSEKRTWKEMARVERNSRAVDQSLSSIGKKLRPERGNS